MQREKGTTMKTGDRETRRRFGPRTLAMLDRERDRLQGHLRKYRQKVAAVSNGEPHHQGCPIGGLAYLPSTASGGPCWCGASEVSE